MEEAQYALGMLYLGAGDVQGMRHDVGKGLHWMRKAASKDHGACVCVLLPFPLCVASVAGGECSSPPRAMLSTH